MNNFFEKITVPDTNNKHYYLLDTSAFNTFEKNREWVDILENAKQIGFCYYKTVLQDYELYGFAQMF